MLVAVTLSLSLFVLPWIWLSVTTAAEQTPEIRTLREWIVEMKESPKGPFSNIRWFCNDGTVLPPRPYACRPHGGGHQHGEWSQRTKELRAAGYKIANFLAGLDPEGFREDPDYESIYKQMLVEHFLIAQDDGWILRKARFYRGAYQSEGEAAGGRALLRSLLADPEWLTKSFLPLREGVRLLPHGRETKSVAEVRQRASQLSKKDRGFTELKNKIHSKPQLEDAVQVRRYAANISDPALRDEFHELATFIEAVYTPLQPGDSIGSLIDKFANRLGQSSLGRACRAAAVVLNTAKQPGERLVALSTLLVALRDALTSIRGTALRLDAVDLSLALEQEYFRTATLLRDSLPHATRQQRVEWLKSAAATLYGTGLLSAREWQALKETFARLQHERVSLRTYKDSLDYLARVPGWANGAMRFHFGPTMTKWATIEPLAKLFVQDRLRGSPLLFYSDVLDTLLRDANQLAGVSNQLFGKNIGTGLRSLNPGLARGTLRLSPVEDQPFDRQGIYLLPETTAELPPVAGILTAGEGNPLSHVQILARNLGIPNVAVDDYLIPELAKHRGKRVILAVSPEGSVLLDEDRGQWDEAFEKEPMEPDTVIRPDLDKLDLSHRELTPTSRIRASDSGRIVGPKAAKLGELYHYYPEAVAEGLVIPFGVFRELLHQPMPGEGKSVFNWMVDQYERLAMMPQGSPERAKATQAFRRRLERWILQADPGPDFKRNLRANMEKVFGPDGSYGVFVRSDTNVEDLPGFTGAGLNRTVPNVVGFENIVRAISLVWASPFSERAFAWRQSHMEQPQHVYPAVLLMRSVPVEKSGVLVTQDIDTGRQNWLSVAVNEGVGGAVDGQAAESLRINLANGETLLLAQATAPVQRVLQPNGGIAKVPVTGESEVLRPNEISSLVAFAQDLPQRFPKLKNASGATVPADIEFGFLDGKLMLFQIRPFLESPRARSSRLLQSLDRNMKTLDAITVSMNTIPKGGS